MVQKSLIYEKVERCDDQEKTCKIQNTRPDNLTRLLLIQEASDYYDYYLTDKDGRQIQEEIEMKRQEADCTHK